MADFEPPTAGPACEQLDLRPIGGDFVPDRHGLASQSMACLPPAMLEIFTQPPQEKSPCDPAYENIEELKRNLGVPACGVNLDGVGLGPGNLLVLGSKIPRVVLSLVKGAQSAKGAKAPTASEASPAAPEAQAKPRVKPSDAPSEAEGKIITLATSGSCPELLQKWWNGLPMTTGGVQLRFGHEIGKYLVIEQRFASDPRKFLLSVFTRNGKVKKEDVPIKVHRDVWNLGDRNANLPEIEKFVQSLR